LVAAYERTKDAYVFGGRRTHLYYASAQNLAVRRTAFERLGLFRERRRGSDTLLVRRAITAGPPDAVRYSPLLSLSGTWRSTGCATTTRSASSTDGASAR
jgi:hypothetical protein